MINNQEDKLLDEVIWGAWTNKQALVCVEGKCASGNMQKPDITNTTTEDSTSNHMSDLVIWDCPVDWL